MSYQPVIPIGGNAGWAFLKRTREVQQVAFESSARMKSDVEYFREKISTVKSAEDLVGDRRLLSVTLGAFGLSEKIDSKFLIRKVLEEGTLSKDALANKLSDPRYKEMARAFGYDLSPPRTQNSDFADKIIALYKERQFEVAVGEQNTDMRLALGLDREIDSLLARDMSDDAMWFTVMATPPMRAVFEAALNIPPAVGALDIDRQLVIFKEKAARTFGSDNLRDFAEPEAREELRRKFFVGSEIAAMSATQSSGSIALTLLQSMPQPASFF